MKYCVDYRRGFKYMDDIDELTIVYNPKDVTLEEFMQAHKDKRINICIFHEQDFIENNRVEVFKQIALNNPDIDFALVIQSLKKSDYAEDIYKAIIAIEDVKLKYFFYGLVSSWDALYGYMQYNPSDIYIVEALGFELDKVAEILHGRNIRIRVFANVAQSSWKWMPALKKFFIRPEDISVYESYVDVIEFFGKRESLETLYRIYAIDKKWFGPLKELITDFDSDLDSRYIVPMFAERRVRCGRRCLKGRPCHVCEAIETLSKTLEDKKLILKVKEDN